MIQPYSIKLDPAVLDDLRLRLLNTRWPDEVGNEKWEMGTNASYLKELCDYWANEYDWQKNASFLNSFSHFKTTVNGTGLHFIHEKGKGSRSIPLLLIHGYPDSFVRFLKIIPLLTSADENGLSFDLVIPSIPGYGFSDIPTEPGMDPTSIAALFTKLMEEELGYQHYFVHGGDWGSSITEQMAINHPRYIKGIHLTEIPWHHIFTLPPDELTESEKKYIQSGQQWSQKEGAYALIQSTKPQSLAYGLNDSPAGLAGWIIEKFYSWSDCNGKLENLFTKDELLNNLMIYWSTQTINSANRLYYEMGVALQKTNKKNIPRTEVPAAVALFPGDMIPPPREYAERIFNVKQWTEMPKGGHFAAMEQPELFVEDVRKFVRSLE